MSKYGHKCNVCAPNNTVQKCSYVVEGDSFKCASMMEGPKRLAGRVAVGHVAVVLGQHFPW